MALTTVTLHGEILNPNGGTPAVGTVVFRTLIELRDVVANITYAPTTFTATLDVNGEFTIVLPATDNPDLVPNSWVYQVYVNTNVWNELFYIQLPFAPGVTEFTDVNPVTYDPCVGLPTVDPTPIEGCQPLCLTGGTLTGNLTINANLDVNGEATVNYGPSFTNVNIGQMLALSASTCLISGGIININAGNPNAADISAATGIIIDTTNPLVPVLTPVSIPAQTIVTAPGLTWFLIDSTSTLITQNFKPSNTQRRTHVQLGAVFNVAPIGIVNDQSLSTIPFDPANRHYDLGEALGAFVPHDDPGNRVTANGVNLMLNKSAGTQFNLAYNYSPAGHNDPDISAIQALTPGAFTYQTALAPVPPGLPVFNVDPANYDPNGLGVVAPVGGGAFTSTIQRLWMFVSNTPTTILAMQYGQQTYASLAAARAAVGAETFIPSPLMAENGCIIAYIVVIRTATDLSNTTQCNIVEAPMFARG